MAKLLTEPQPSSSVVNFLDPHISAVALAKPGQVPSPQLFTPVAEQITSPESVKVVRPRRLVTRQFRLPLEADNTLQELIRIFSEASEVNMKMTEVLCAVMQGIQSALPEIEREAKNLGTLKRPKNDLLNSYKKEEFLKEMAKRFVAGMRATGILV